MRIFTTIFFTVITSVLLPISRSADYAKGQEACNSGDYETALTEWAFLANQGDADGQLGMGLLHDNGWTAIKTC